MSLLRTATLLFLLRTREDVPEICLAMKKRGFGAGRWNGTGGKVEAGETIEAAALRETAEEIGVHAQAPRKIAELSFYFPHQPAWDQCVHVFFADSWEGEPTESEEMRPQWFAYSEIPWDSMWPDDRFWLPAALEGAELRAKFVFGEGDVIIEQEVTAL